LPLITNKLKNHKNIIKESNYL